MAYSDAIFDPFICLFIHVYLFSLLGYRFLQRVSIALAMQSAVLAMIDSV